jgi:hypothetical protein
MKIDNKMAQYEIPRQHHRFIIRNIMSSLEWYLAKDCSTTTCNPQHQDFLLRIPVKLKNIYYYLLKANNRESYYIDICSTSTKYLDKISGSAVASGGGQLSGRMIETTTTLGVIACR